MTGEGVFAILSRVIDVFVKTIEMKRSWTAFLIAVGALPISALAGPQYSAEEIIDHFMRTPAPGAAGAAQGADEPRVRGVFIGAAGFGNEASAAAASQGAAAGDAAQGGAPTGALTEAQAAAQPVAGEAPLALPMTGAGAGQTQAAAGTGQPTQPPTSSAPGSYDLLITFELDSATLTPQAQQNLDAFVAALRSRALRPYRFSVEGHTDSTGSQAYNQKLSERRAASVVNYLVANGVESSRVMSRGYGETRPRLADPEHPENRRVETRRIQ